MVSLLTRWTCASRQRSGWAINALRGAASVAIFAAAAACGSSDDSEDLVDAATVADATLEADASGVDARFADGVVVTVDGVQHLLNEAFFRWDDATPGLCLSDRPVNEQCGLNEKSDMTVLFARYVVLGDGSAQLSLVQTSLRVIEAGQERFLVAKDGTLDFSSHDPAAETAVGTIDVLFAEGATALGGFAVP